MLKTKRLILLLTVIMLFSIFVGSGCKTPYNIVFYDKVSGWINNDFAGLSILNEQESEHKNRGTFIVNNKEEYDKIFIEGITQLDIDFNTQMIVVFVYVSYLAQPNYLEDAYVRNNELIINLEHEPVPKDSYPLVNPYWRWIVFKMDKLEVESAGVYGV